MLAVLLESQAHRSRRIGGSVVSLVTHGAMLGIAILATAQNHHADAAPPPVEVIKVGLVPPPPPTPVPVRPVGAPALSSSPVAAPVFDMPKLPPLQIPSAIPTDIPEPRFDVPTTVEGQQFSRAGDGARAPRGVLGDGTGEGSPSGVTWSESDIALHLAAKPVPPRYPSQLQRAGIDGRVLVRFVVDTTCRVDMQTIEVVESSHELFTAAVRTALPDLRFQCGRAGNRKIRVLAAMPFVFQLSR